jgi:hypothetical protein
MSKYVPVSCRREYLLLQSDLNELHVRARFYASHARDKWESFLLRKHIASDFPLSGDRVQFIAGLSLVNNMSSSEEEEVFMHMLSDGGGGTISGCIISARSE